MFRRLLLFCIPAGLAVSSAWSQEPIALPKIKLRDADPCPQVQVDPCQGPTIRVQVPAPKVVIQQAAPAVVSAPHGPLLPCFHRAAVGAVYVQPALVQPAYVQPALIQPAVVYAQPMVAQTFVQPQLSFAAPLQLTLTPAVAAPCPDALAKLSQNMAEAAAILKTQAQLLKNHEERITTVEGQMRDAKQTLDALKGVTRDPKTGFLKAP